ncbi:family 10 glycosylhydrolase [Leptolyngbya sp. GB1-A1]|uniref:glycoside hydrolase family 10 protein n=1 Tax=Leptolyngbya sp. GB1-A1 TaxID=2933908 RepID=UPI0032988745
MPVLRIVQNTVFKKAPLSANRLSLPNKFMVTIDQLFEIRYAFRVGDHCFVELTRSLGTVGKLGYFLLSHVRVAIQELRAVWLTNVDSRVLYSRSNLVQGLQWLKELGFNTVYPVVWNKGFTLYPSSVAQDFFGSAVTPDPNFANRDMLAELVAEARILGLRVIPWFEYGLMALPGSPIATRYPNFITTDQQNNSIRTGKVWLNPCHPEVQQFIVDLIADVAARYDVDGVQLDDNFGLPIELGYDAFSQALYRQENQNQWMPIVPNDSRRQQWLTDKITLLFQRIFREVKTKRSCLMSLSPNPLGFSRRNYCVDWRSWQQEGWVEELVLQVYRSNLSAFLGEIDKAEVIDIRSHIPTAIGILTGLRTSSVRMSQIQEQVQTTRQKQFAGISCFFYETLFYEQLSPQKIARNLTDLKVLFPGNS